MANAFTTKLEAINTILQIIDEEPINSLNDELPLEATTAIHNLEEVSREIQSKGYDFNTEYEFPLPPNLDGTITLPQSTLSFDIPKQSINGGGIDYIQRGVRVYNRTDRTFIINKTLKAMVVSFLNWDDLPEQFRKWITIRTARITAARTVGDQATVSFSMQEEIEAKANAENSDARSSNATIFDNTISQLITNRNIRRGGNLNY
jgi:hypothetical protein